MRATRVVLNLEALRHNLAVARQAAPGSRIVAAIKAEAYGHGLARVARALSDADAFGVASLGEALQLREAGITTEIQLFEGLFHRDEVRELEQHGFTTVVHQFEQIEMLAQARSIRPIRVWLKVDSGMHRLGFLPAQVRKAWEHLGRLTQVERVGAMTHLANADDLTDPSTPAQLHSFFTAVEGLTPVHSIANSAGLLGWPGSRSQWVRPGIMLYGVSPFLGRQGHQDGLRPVMSFCSELIAVKWLGQGDAVGYGGSWRCPEAMPVGVVAAGYGDGYPRHAPNGTPVLVNGRRVPLVGRVSMDMLMVDLRSQSQARVGDPVTLWGEGLPVEEVAQASGTIAYELLCGITPRVARMEVDHGVLPAH